MIFLKFAFMRFHTTHHIYKFALRKKVFENIFFLEKSPVQPLALSAMSEAAASAARTSAVAAKFHDGGAQHSLSPSPSPLLLPSPR
jgi:hypothetical protein